MPLRKYDPGGPTKARRFLSCVNFPLEVLTGFPSPLENLGDHGTRRLFSRLRPPEPLLTVSKCSSGLYLLASPL